MGEKLGYTCCHTHRAAAYLQQSPQVLAQLSGCHALALVWSIDGPQPNGSSLHSIDQTGGSAVQG